METVICEKHGSHNIVMACTHVIGNAPKVIYLVPEDGEEEATVWCETCETARIKDKGWYDYADNVASWKIICTKCLNKIIDTADECVIYEGERTPDE